MSDWFILWLCVSGGAALGFCLACILHAGRD